MTRTLRLTLQYDGTRYAGWQIQPGRPTIQGAVEDALGRILDARTPIVGSGRTDAGVHARGQVASFRTGSPLGPAELRRALNALLPWDVRVTEVAEAPAGFHARSSARSKEYRYQLWTGEVTPPFLHAYALAVPCRLDPARFREAAGMILGRHDFTAFASTGSTPTTPVRTVTVSELAMDGELWVYRIAADGFLYRMVRTIAGTLVEIARGRWEPGRIAELFAAPDRARAGPALPARGLFLHRVDYALTASGE